MGSAGELNTNGLNHITRFYDANFGVRWDQVITYEKASGWIQWTWKTEMADEWSYSAGIRYGWIPRDPTQRQHASICD